MTLAYIPSPTISQFSIGPVTIHIYALCILMGIVLAVWITTTRWKKLGGNFDQVLDITLVSVPAGIIGARLYHIITTPERFFGPDGDWAEMFRIWNGGLGIWGGVLFGALAAWAWCRHKHYPMALLADAIAPGLLVAQAVGRLGNWFNQELYGAPTTLPWGLKLNMEGTAIGHSEQCYDGATCPSGTLFHPTFLYEMIWNLIGAAIIVYIGSKAMKKLKAGSLFAVYIMWYTLGRTWIESLRIDYAHEFLGVRINVWVSMAVFVLGAVSFIVVQQMGKDTDLLAEKLRTVTEIEQRLENGESEDSSDSVVSFPEQPTMPKLSRIPTSSPASNNSKSITFHRIRAMTIQIAPSILSADFCNLERDLKAISNADLVHVDVMDHHFVPNLTLGEPIVARICEVTDLPVDVHLMIEDPDRWAPEYAKLGAASVSFHMGATHAPVRLARQLREMGCKACFAVRPAEPVEPIFDILDEFDMILIMTVEPGFGGQKFLDNQMAKVRRLRDEITRRGLATKIQVDGGVSPKTAHIVAEAGADVLVAGSAVYGAEDPAEAIDSIREKAEAAFKA